jgi:hypothetical protein
MGRQTPAYELDVAVNAIRKQLYADYKTPAAEQQGDADLLAPCGYKARPLIGIWATLPFHTTARCGRSSTFSATRGRRSSPSAAANTIR